MIYFSNFIIFSTEYYTIYISEYITEGAAKLILAYSDFSALLLSCEIVCL